MATSYSQLVFRRLIPPESATQSGSLIALHGTNGGLDDLQPLTEAFGSDRLRFFPEAARGVFKGTTVISRTWFGGTLERPEAASFGDSLAQIERFIHDVQNRVGADAPRPWLLGYDQGAVLALAIALIAPDLISGVMAIAGGLPSFTTEGLLEPVESALPVLMIGDAANQAQDTYLQSTAMQLRQVGNQVTVRWLHDADALGTTVGDELRSWLDQHSHS